MKMEYKKKIFQILYEEIEANAKVHRYYDREEKAKIDIYMAKDRPEVMLSTYSTIGLSEYTIGVTDRKGREIRVEFIGVCSTEVEIFPDILSSCAFNIINSKYTCKPGIVYPGVISSYLKETDMKHIYFASPFLWEGLQGHELNNHAVAWLLVIPISDAEFDYLRYNGDEAFEELLEQSEVDFSDIYRNSVI